MIAAWEEQERRLQVLHKIIMPPSHLLARSLVDFASKVASAALDTATLRFLSFVEAFGDVLPPDAPASVVRVLFGEVRQFISEAAARNAQSGKHNPSAE